MLRRRWWVDRSEAATMQMLYVRLTRLRQWPGLSADGSPGMEGMTPERARACIQLLRLLVITDAERLQVTPQACASPPNVTPYRALDRTRILSCPILDSSPDSGEHQARPLIELNTQHTPPGPDGCRAPAGHPSSLPISSRSITVTGPWTHLFSIPPVASKPIMSHPSLSYSPVVPPGQGKHQAHLIAMMGGCSPLITIQRHSSATSRYRTSCCVGLSNLQTPFSRLASSLTDNLVLCILSSASESRDSPAVQTPSTMEVQRQRPTCQARVRPAGSRHCSAWRPSSHLPSRLSKSGEPGSGRRIAYWTALMLFQTLKPPTCVNYGGSS